MTVNGRRPPSLGLSRLATLNLLRKDPIALLERAAAVGEWSGADAALLHVRGESP